MQHHTRPRCLTAALLLSLLILPACSRPEPVSAPAASVAKPTADPTPAPAQQPAPTTQTLPPPPARPPLSAADELIGGLRPGMTAAEAKAARPDLTVDAGPPEEIWWLGNRSSGFVIPSGGKAVTIVLKAPADGKTARGLQVGDSLSRVYELYGAPEQNGMKYRYQSPDGLLSLVLQFQGTPPDAAARVYSISLARNK